MGLGWKLPKIYYGWYIVGACFLIALYTGGVVYYGFTAFIDPIADELGWSYTQISLAASLRGLEMGFLAPVTGMLVDRWGPRRILFFGALITGGGFILLNQVTTLTMFYIAFGIVGAGMSTCENTVLMSAIARWFKRKVGIAGGIALCGYGVSGLLIPLIVRLIDIYDWRITAVITGVGLLAVVMPLALLVRHKPEQYGYLPDGDTIDLTTAGQSTDPVKSTEAGIKVKQALKSRDFWQLVIPLTVQMTAITAVTTLVIPYLSSVGIDRTSASLAASAILMLSIGGRLGFGWLADNFDRRYVTAGTTAAMSIGLFIFAYISTDTMWLLLIPFFIFCGGGFGGSRSVLAPLVRAFFGIRNFASIIGCMNGIMCLGSIVGAPLAAWVFDTYGSYQGTWLVFSGVLAASIISIVSTPAPGTLLQKFEQA